VKFFAFRLNVIGCHFIEGVKQHALTGNNPRFVHEETQVSFSHFLVKGVVFFIGYVSSHGILLLGHISFPPRVLPDKR
jgi:hypothetical protein